MIFSQAQNLGPKRSNQKTRDSRIDIFTPLIIFTRGAVALTLELKKSRIDSLSNHGPVAEDNIPTNLLYEVFVSNFRLRLQNQYIAHIKEISQD